MTIASRTPEGSPQDCPICGQAVCVEPSLPFGDAPCPACGTLLWFVVTDQETRWLNPTSDTLSQLLLDRFGITLDMLRTRSIKNLPIDSLDLVELVMELEDAAG
ncbi:MAG: phosphopantetheine-binding protein [Schlesneria sp.]|nr:phosphopantetheine-binding protein [Schlesneria sp.]